MEQTQKCLHSFPHIIVSQYNLYHKQNIGSTLPRKYVHYMVVIQYNRWINIYFTHFRLENNHFKSKQFDRCYFILPNTTNTKKISFTSKMLLRHPGSSGKNNSLHLSTSTIGWNWMFASTRKNLNILYMLEFNCKKGVIERHATRLIRGDVNERKYFFFLFSIIILLWICGYIVPISL